MKAEDIENIKKLLQPVFKKNNVQKAIVFSSVGRATDTKKSDIDIMIVMKTDKRFDDFNEIYALNRGRSVDLIIYTHEELEEISHRP